MPDDLANLREYMFALKRELEDLKRQIYDMKCLINHIKNKY